jgi:hypothetical protein
MGVAVGVAVGCTIVPVGVGLGPAVAVDAPTERGVLVTKLVGRGVAVGVSVGPN